MPGCFNNETGMYENVPWMEHGEWFEDDDGNLYIVTDESYGSSENEGPDGPVMDELNRICREKGTLSIEDGEAIGLHWVPPVLHRFSAHDGYYHA